MVAGLIVNLLSSKLQTVAKVTLRWFTPLFFFYGFRSLRVWQSLCWSADAIGEYPSRNDFASTYHCRIRLDLPKTSSNRSYLCFPLFRRLFLHVSHTNRFVLVEVPYIDHMPCSSWIYSSSLAYVVDANVGRSSTAAAANSAFRGIFAFIATEIAVPLQVCLFFQIWR